jgi:hypothetical protein
LIIRLNEKGCPLMLARFIRTANVLAGWTSTHPSTPPRPDVANATDIGVFEGLWLPWVAMLAAPTTPVDDGITAAADGGGFMAVVAMMMLLLL